MKSVFASSIFFTTANGLRTDLSGLRSQKTILLDAYDGTYSVGLKPVGDTPDQWQVVETDQIIATSSKDHPLNVQEMMKPKIMSCE